jgi:hypothetical protein
MPELIDPKWRVKPANDLPSPREARRRNAPKKIATVVFDSDVEEFASVAN